MVVAVASLGSALRRNEMTDLLKEYQEFIRKTRRYVVDTHMGRVGYCALGLAGEAGEVANEVKKAVRDDGSELTTERTDKIIDENGDTLWYVVCLADELGVSLEDLIRMNMAKLSKRMEASR